MEESATISHKVEEVKAMFMGEYNHSIDAKGRLILPSRFREELGTSFVIAKGYDKCLNVYPIDEWNKFVEELKKLNLHNPDARRVLRIFSSGAVTCEPDKQGRVVIPANLRSYGGMEDEKNEVVVVGALNKIEIWSKEPWLKYNEGNDSMSLEEAGAKLANLNH